MHGVVKHLWLAALLAGVAASQDASSAKVQGGEVATFQTKTELVLVPVVVTDKKGQHVHGLTKDDFVVLEDDRGKGISSFEVVHTEPRIMQLSSGHEVFTNTVKPEATQA